MNEFEHRIAKATASMMDDALMAAMTGNVPSEPQRAFCMADLQFGMIIAGKPRPNVGKIIESIYMTERRIDWSLARSPSRTARRMRYNTARLTREMPRQDAMQMEDGTLIMHPAVAARVRNAINTS